jgi:hypothetical protein
MFLRSPGQLVPLSVSRFGNRWEWWECLTAATIFGGNPTNNHSHQEVLVSVAHSHHSHRSAEWRGGKRETSGQRVNWSVILYHDWGTTEG